MSLRHLVSPETASLVLPEPIHLESGEVLREVEVAYRTWGRPSARASLICHALTGNADADDWWGGLFGPGRVFDPERDYIIATNVLGSCYGTTGPLTPHPSAEGHFGADFPSVSIRDMIEIQARLLDQLGVETLELVAGGSMGGMQVLEWARMYPDRVEAIAPVAVSGRHSAWCIGISECQRQAIRTDPAFLEGRYDIARQPVAGLSAARMMAIVSYRSPESLRQRFERQLRDEELFEVESYLRYQGHKLVQRFDANTYITLTYAMDSHDIARDRGRYEDVLRSIEQPAMVVGVTSDVLYPLAEQRELVAGLGNAELGVIEAPHGHDSFLIEFEQLNRLLVDFKQRVRAARAVGIAPG